MFVAKTIRWCMVLLLAAFMTEVNADEIRLRNGDRISGRVIEAQQGELTIETPYAGRIAVRLEQIDAIWTETPVTVRLNGKERLAGRLTTREGEMLVVDGEDRDEVPVRWEQVRSINVPELLWSGNLHLGGVHRSGNTDRRSIRFGAEAVRRSDKNRLNLSFLYNYAEEDGELAARDVYGALKHDHFYSRRLYLLLGIELLNDRFRDLRLRTVVGPGFGYQVWEETRKALALEAGIAYFREERIEDEDDDWFTARLSATFRYQLTPWLRFSDTLILYPQLEASGQYTLRNEAALLTTLSAAWSLRLDHLWERDSDPPPGVKKDDLRTSVGLQYAF